MSVLFCCHNLSFSAFFLLFAIPYSSDDCFFHKVSFSCFIQLIEVKIPVTALSVLFCDMRVDHLFLSQLVLYVDVS